METAINLYEHQQELLRLNPEKHLIAWATGTGKTHVALALAERNKLSGKLLIVCPKGLRRNWERAVAEWGIEAIIMTKEEFRRDWDEIPEVLGEIIDEAHFFAGKTSQMSKNLEKFNKKWNVHYRWFLTATPFLRDAWNIYTLSKLLGQSMNYQRFRDTFFYDVHFGRRVVPMARPGMEGVLKELVLKIGSTKRLDECVDVPEQTYETEYFALTKSQKSAIAEISETNHITRWTMIHQICGGSLGADDYMPLRVYDSQKRERLIELAKEQDRMIVVCRYRSEVEVVAEELRTVVPLVEEMTGDTKDRQELLDRLGKSEKYALVVSAQISEGWELPNCDIIVFYSYDFSLKNKIQMEGRIRRINNLKKNVYLSLVVEDSIDEDVFGALKKKEDFHVELYRKDI